MVFLLELLENKRNHLQGLLYVINVKKLNHFLKEPMNTIYVFLAEGEQFIILL